MKRPYILYFFFHNSRVKARLRSHTSYVKRVQSFHNAKDAKFYAGEIIQIKMFMQKQSIRGHTKLNVFVKRRSDVS